MAKFFDLQKNKRFSMQPRYYDERAEQRKDREKVILKELESEKAGRPSRLTKDQMDNYIKMTRRTRKKSNLRLLAILALLLLIFYIFFLK